MLRPPLLAFTAVLMIFGTAAVSQEMQPAPGASGAPPEQAGPADPAMTGGTARPRPPAAARPAPPPAVSRQARPRRSYRSCLRRAKELRGLRGAQRRAFITRCQLGFRRQR